MVVVVVVQCLNVHIDLIGALSGGAMGRCRGVHVAQPVPVLRESNMTTTDGRPSLFTNIYIGDPKDEGSAGTRGASRVPAGHMDRHCEGGRH